MSWPGDRCRCSRGPRPTAGPGRRDPDSHRRAGRHVRSPGPWRRDAGHLTTWQRSAQGLDGADAHRGAGIPTALRVDRRDPLDPRDRPADCPRASGSAASRHSVRGFVCDHATTRSRSSSRRPNMERTSRCPRPVRPMRGSSSAETSVVATGTTEGDGRGVYLSVWCWSPRWPNVAPTQEACLRSVSCTMTEPRSALMPVPTARLVGDGLRMIAYRGWGDDQAGWTSFDGRTWQPIAFEGRPERSTYWLDDRLHGDPHSAADRAALYGVG